MTDMTLCSGDRCPIKQKCYRFTHKAYGRQNYFVGTPYNFTTQTCNYFWPIPQPTEQDIQVHAYHIWQRLGSPEGQDMEIWLQAQRELEQSFGQ